MTIDALIETERDEIIKKRRALVEGLDLES